MPRASEDATRKKADAERARRAAKKAVAAAASGHPKPNRRAPNGCVWDGRTEPAGVWRRRDTNEIYDPSAVAAATAARNAAHLRTTDAARARNAAQQRVTAQRANQRVRRRKHMRARCNESLFKPGFKYEWVEQHDAGTLSSTMCTASKVSTSGCASSAASLLMRAGSRFITMACGGPFATTNGVRQL